MEIHGQIHTKVCCNCGEIKPLSDFYKRWDYNGYRHTCKDCERIRKQKHKATQQNKYRVKQKYGITIEEYNRCMASSTSCAICGSTHKLCYDHDHTTMKFRGVLCHNCNTSLGVFGDSIGGVQRVIKYLEGNK